MLDSVLFTVKYTICEIMCGMKSYEPTIKIFVIFSKLHITFYLKNTKCLASFAKNSWTKLQSVSVIKHLFKALNHILSTKFIKKISISNLNIKKNII